jgi:hypothetical protein
VTPSKPSQPKRTDALPGGSIRFGEEVSVTGMARGLVVGLIVSTGATDVASAEGPPQVAASPRVRVTAPAVSGKRIVGTLVRMDDTMLAIRRDKGKSVLEVPRAAVTRIEASRRPGRRGLGAGIGALVGLGAALAIGLGAGQSCTGSEIICFDKTTTTVAGALLTVPAGALIGLAVAPGEKWVAVRPDRLGLAATAAQGGGFRAGVALRF